MANTVDYLLIGGGLASATAAETLRKEGAGGRIVIVSEENYPPYHRPPLSKGFLLGKQKKERIVVLKDGYYRENDIELLLGTRVLSVDPRERIVKTDNSGELRYKKLLIATGCRISKLSVPGSSLPGIYYLRTLNDAEALKQAIERASRAVVIGGSFIGMELASTFRQKGMEVTIITQEEIIFDKLSSPEVSDFFRDYYKAHGVRIISGETAREFIGENSVKGVITNTGKEFPCDLVAIGIGVVPNTDFLQGSGIKLEDGVVVDEYMQTNNPDVFAAGDVANFFDPVFGRRRRIEHWDNAMKQGQVAARNMMGHKQPYRTVSYFFSDVFDLTFNFLGDTADTNERVVRGSIEEKSFSVLYLKNGVLRAAFLLRRPTDEDKSAGSLIQNRVDLKKVKSKLSDEAFKLHTIPTQTVLILQGGGALGAFQCGVIKAMEERQIYPDIVAGVSIGAFNGAIIASNPRNSAKALEAFWDEITVNIPNIPKEGNRRLVSSWYSLIFGSPKFFRPRWLMPVFNPHELPINWTSFYDPSPVRELLLKYVDFDKLRDSPTRLIIGAVDVETSGLVAFDSYVDEITPEHILASGSLPPGFPWTTIDGKHYWDGALVSNTPLDLITELCGLAQKKVYVVNLYPTRKALPQNLPEVLARRDEIFFSEKIRRDIHTKELIENYRRLVEEIMGYLEPGVAQQIMQRPLYIRTMGELTPISITRIVHEGEEGEPSSRDYDFSWRTARQHMEEGYRVAKRILRKESRKKVSYNIT